MKNQSRIVIATLGISIGCLLHVVSPAWGAEPDASDSMTARRLVQLPLSEIQKFVDQILPQGTTSQQVVQRMKKIGFECKLVQDRTFQSDSEIVSGVIQGIYLPNRYFISCGYADKYQGCDRVNGIMFLLDGDGKVERCRVASFLRVP